MKKLFLLLPLCVIVILANAQQSFKQLTISPQYPQAGQTIEFSFDAAQSSLASEKDVELAVYLFTNKNGVRTTEPVLKQEGKLYRGSFTVDNDINAFAFAFSAGDKKETNDKNGFVIPVYTASQKPVAGYYASAGMIYGGFGEQFIGVKTDPVYSLSIMDEGRKDNPSLEQDINYWNSYLQMTVAAKKKDAEEAVLQLLSAYGSGKKLREEDYTFLSNWYRRFKKNTTADSLTALMKKEFPSGAWVKEARFTAMQKEMNAAKLQELIDEYEKTYAPLDETGKQLVQRMYARLAGMYKNGGKTEEMLAAAKKMSASERYSFYNEAAWTWAENKQQMELAERMAEEATAGTKEAITNPTEKKPDYMTQKAWLRQRKSNYAMYADTYAFILYEKGEYKKGLPYAKDAAEMSSFKDEELNERYALLLAKAAPAAEAKTVIEKMMGEGKATEKTKYALKEVFIASGNKEADFEGYVSSLEKAAKEKRKQELVKSKIKETAPNFSLKDFDGNMVALKDLRGKVVVLDFWATWCGPCIASMPAMKLAEEKLKTRGDVVFLFIDTWENVTDKKQNAMNFMKKKDYPFKVLMDDENVAVGDYGVEGIPARFIVDKEGNIAFKTTGFSGSIDEMVDELTVMVELAAK